MMSSTPESGTGPSTLNPGVELRPLLSVNSISCGALERAVPDNVAQTVAQGAPRRVQVVLGVAIMSEVCPPES